MSLFENPPYLEKHQALTQAMGEFIGRFSLIEGSLLMLFATSLGISNTHAAAIINPVKTFSLALEMTDASVQFKLKGAPQLVYWNSLVSYIRELSGDRNFIAHSPIVIHSDGQSPDQMTTENTRPLIGPVLSGYLLDVERIPPMDDTEVSELVEDVTVALEHLTLFTEAFLKQDTSQQKFLSPISRRRQPRKQRLADSRK